MTSLADIIVPMPGLIAVQIDTKDEITPQGLFIPRDVARTVHESQRPTHGRVVAIGEVDTSDPDDPDVDLGPDLLPVPRVAVGDHVLFSKFSGTKISRTVPGPNPKTPKIGEVHEVIIIMREVDILAKIVTPIEASSLKVRS